MQHVGLEDRASDVPPCDSLAEAVVLAYVLHHAPEKVVGCDLLPLLTFPEHRAIWRVMQRVYRPGESHERFFVRWLNEAEREQPGLSEVLLDIGNSWSLWQDNRLERDSERYRSVSTMDWDWWFTRLRQVATARRLFDENQRSAERLWRGDVEGALDVMRRAVMSVPVDQPGMEIPVA